MTIACMFLVTAVFAQKENKQVESETYTKKYTVDYGEETISYMVSITDNEANYVKMEREDLAKEEQDRVVPSSRMVKKTIRIDADSDPNYDNILVLTYETKEEDHFEITPTSSGFVMKVTGHSLNYHFIKKEYEIINEDESSFEVDIISEDE